MLQHPFVRDAPGPSEIIKLVEMVNKIVAERGYRLPSDSESGSELDSEYDSDDPEFEVSKLQLNSTAFFKSKTEKGNKE